MEIKRIETVLGGEKTLHMRIRKRQDLITLSNHGVTKTALINLAKCLALTVGQIARLLPVSERTLQRYPPQKHFNAAVSERVLRLAEVAARGAEVFGDKDRFLAWINQPSVPLGGSTPLSLLGSSFGTEMVLDELGRIEHGVLS
jgi:putative toxin-antitoxin system antitoxin component (TIGR02293 family)